MGCLLDVSTRCRDIFPDTSHRIAGRSQKGEGSKEDEGSGHVLSK